MPIVIQIEQKVRNNIGLLECWTGIATDETFGSSGFCTTCEHFNDCIILYRLLRSSRGNLHPASLARRIAIFFDIETEYMRSQAELESTDIIVERDTNKRTGVPQCISCGKDADDVHEIVPRSSFGSRTKEECFDVRNRCCLCRDCHAQVANDLGRGRLLSILADRYGYEYTQDPWAWLIENYRNYKETTNGKV